MLYYIIWMENHFDLYGLTQDVFGHVYNTSVKDVLELKMRKEETGNLVNEFLDNSTKVNNELKQIESQFGDKLTKPVGEGKRLFKVKASRYKSKFS